MVHGAGSSLLTRISASRFPLAKHIMAPTLAFVASLLVVGQAIRSEDDLHEGIMHRSGGVVEESAALICSLGWQWVWPNYEGKKETEPVDHSCCAAAKKCKQGKATTPCPTKCNAKVMGVMDLDIWLPDSCVKPTDVTPPTAFNGGVTNSVPGRPNEALAPFQDKKLTAKNDKVEITC